MVDKLTKGLPKEGIQKNQSELATQESEAAEQELRHSMNSTECYLRLLSRVSPRLHPFLSAPLMLFIPYLFWRLVIFIFFQIELLPLHSIFVVRDILAIWSLSPTYLYFMDTIRNMPEQLRKHLIDQEDFFDRVFKRLFSNTGFILAGIIASFLYLGVNLWHIIWGNYTWTFFLDRMTGILGFFLIGGLLYQGAVLIIALAKDAKNINLRISALVEGLESISDVARNGTLCWIIGVSLIMLTVIFLGVNLRILFYYIFAYGTLYVLGIFAFLAFCYGFHKSMVRCKSNIIKKIAHSLNTEFSGFITTIENGGTPDIKVVTLLDVYKIANDAKEWPFDMRAVRDLTFTYLIPLAISLVRLFL